MSTGVFFSGMMPGETLEKFLDRVVRPNTSFLSQSNQVIDTVVRLLHQKIPYSVNQIVKGGSLGKGTGVRNKSDVDLLVVLNDFRNIETLMDNLPRVLRDIQNILETTVRSCLPEADVKIIGKTPFTLQFRLQCHYSYEWFDVDLLPIIDVWSSWLLVFDGKQSAYNRMESEPYLRGYYAKCLAKLKVDFVKRRPAKVKDLIRLLKYWNKAENVGLSSYCVELLVINVWEKEGGYPYFTLKSLMTAVVNELVHFRQLRICWNTNYNPGRYCRFMGAPYVLDPANPFNNVAQDDWSLWSGSTVENKAGILQRRLFDLPDETTGLFLILALIVMLVEGLVFVSVTSGKH